MKYLPFEDFEIHTDLTSDEVFYRLHAAVDTERKWLIFTNKPFWGEVDILYFRIWRATWWSHNFTPVVSGKIDSEDSGCCIGIQMRMPWFGFLFYTLIIVWLWVLYFGGISSLIIQRIQTGIWQIDSPWMLLPGIVMIAFAYLISVGTFMSERDKVVQYLSHLFGIRKKNIKYKNLIFGATEYQIIRTLLLVTVITSLGWIVLNLL